MHAPGILRTDAWMAQDGHLSWVSGLLDLGLDLISACRSCSLGAAPLPSLFPHPPCGAWQFLPPWALLTGKHDAVIHTL